MTGQCVIWTGSIDRYGYGRLPGGRMAHHLCRNRACVNAGHMEPVTNAENILRGISVSAVNARKTHCVNGHPFDEGNTSVRTGERVCKACHRANQSRYRARRAAA